MFIDKIRSEVKRFNSAHGRAPEAIKVSQDVYEGFEGELKATLVMNSEEGLTVCKFWGIPVEFDSELSKGSIVCK